MSRILADRTLWIPALAGMTDGGMGGPIHPSNITTRRVGSRPELEDEMPGQSVGGDGWTVVAAHARSGRVDYRHGVAVVVVRVRLLVLLAEQSSGIVLIDAFDANACGGLIALHAGEVRQVVVSHQGDWTGSGRPALADGYSSHERLRGSAEIVEVDDLDAGPKCPVDARLHGEFLLL